VDSLKDFFFLFYQDFKIQIFFQRCGLQKQTGKTIFKVIPVTFFLTRSPFQFLYFLDDSFHYMKLFHLLLLFSLPFVVGCSHGWIFKPLQFEESTSRSSSKSLYYEKTYHTQLQKLSNEDTHILISVNLFTKINLCGKEIEYPEAKKRAGYKMLLLPIQYNDCNLKIVVRSELSEPSLNKVFIGSLSELWILQIKRDGFLILFAVIYLLLAFISIFIFITRFSDIRFLSLAILLFTASGYTLAIGNGLIGMVFRFFSDSIWPHVLFGSLYLFPSSLLYFLSLVIKSKWGTRFKIGAFAFLFFWALVEISVLFGDHDYNTFLVAYHLLCIIALFVFFPPAVLFLIESKNGLLFILYGLTILLFFGFLEMVISYYTKSLEIPLLPFGIFVFLLSLGFWGFKSYQNLELKLKHVIEIKKYRKLRFEKDSKNRVSLLNEEKIMENLNLLMEREKVYLDENLNLNILSNLLGIRIDQLSFLINNRLGKPFSHYLNEYRINEAKNMLLKKETNILNIAFSVGFQSKSAFNSAFKKYTGKTPTEFRKLIEH